MDLKHLFFKFWKHPGAVVVLILLSFMTYDLMPDTISIILTVIEGGFSGELTGLGVLTGITIVFMLLLRLFLYSAVYWVLVNLLALLFCFRMQDTQARQRRYKRIVFWSLVVLLIGSVGNMSQRATERRIETTKKGPVLSGGVPQETAELEIRRGEFTEGIMFTTSDNLSQITVPSWWQEMPELNDDATLCLGYDFGQRYLIIITDDKADLIANGFGKLSDFVRVVIDDLVSSFKNVVLSEPVPMNIDGYSALQYEFTGIIDGITIEAVHTSVEGTRHFYQVYAWTAKHPIDRFNKDRKEKLRYITSSASMLSLR